MDAAIEILAEQREKGLRKMEQAAKDPRLEEFRPTVLWLLSALKKEKPHAAGSDGVSAGG